MITFSCLVKKESSNCRIKKIKQLNTTIKYDPYELCKIEGHFIYLVLVVMFILIKLQVECNETALNACSDH